MKKLLSILMAAVLLLTALSASVSTFAAGEYDGKTVIVYTSNLRGDISKLPKIAAVKADFESKGADVILADTGNFLQGSAIASYDRGYTVFTLMEQAGYDVVALGKYDFAFGNAQTGAKPHGTLKTYLTLSQLLNGGEGDGLSKEASSIKAVSINAGGSNAYFTFEGNMAPYTVLKDFTFFGATDTDVTKIMLEDSLAGITFTDAASVKVASENTAVYLSNDKSFDRAGIVLSPSSDAFEISAAVIDGDMVAIETLNLNSYADNEELRAAVDEALAKADTSALVQSEVILNGAQKAVRGEETNLGDLWCDALRWYATSGKVLDYYTQADKDKGNTSITVDNDHVVAIWNGGNLRDFIYDGNVALSDIHKVLPYPNTVAVAYVKGAQLEEALEAAQQYDAAFAQTAGINYTIKSYVEFEAGEQYENSNYFAPKSDKVVIESINGKAFDKNATYAVITSNMIYNGGDTYSAFKEKAENAGSTITTRRVTDAVWDYINEELGGVITADYAAAQNRIHFQSADPKNGWVKANGKWYYYTDGTAATGWKKVGGKWYYLNKSGVMQTGWQKVSGKWYYLNKSGAMQTGWQKISGKWYYLNKSGAMQTGWVKVSGKWYYMNSSGAMKTGWLKLSDKWYYLNTNGAMVTGSKKINGKTYQFNASGVCKNP